MRRCGLPDEVICMINSSYVCWRDFPVHLFCLLGLEAYCPRERGAQDAGSDGDRKRPGLVGSGCVDLLSVDPFGLDLRQAPHPTPYPYPLPQVTS